jgi:O-antigen/teichoic acid export membrane protein
MTQPSDEAEKPVRQRARNIRDVALYLTPLVVGNLIPIVTLPVFTRILSTDEYGVWALANVYAVSIGGVVNAGLPVSYERNFFQCADRVERGRLLYSILSFVSVMFAIAAVGTWIWGETISRWVIGVPGQRPLLFWSLCASGVATLKLFYMMHLRNVGAAAAYARYSVQERVIAAVVSLLLVAWIRVGVIGLVFGQLIATTIVLLLIASKVRSEHPFGLSWPLLADALRIGLPVTPRAFLGVIGRNLDKYLIGQLASIGSVGVYSIGQRVANITFTYCSALENVFMPRVYSQMFDLGPEGGNAVGRYLTPFVFASTGIALMIALFSEEILLVLAPAAYLPAIPVITLLTISYATFFGKIPQLTYARKTHIASLLAFVTMLVTAALQYLFIRRWAAMGAAWGTLLANAAYILALLTLGQRYYRIGWETRRLIGIFGLFVLGSLAVLLLRAWGTPYAFRLVFKLTIVGLFAALGRRLGYLSRGAVADVVDALSGRKFAAPVAVPAAEAAADV